MANYYTINQILADMAKRPYMNANLKKDICCYLLEYEILRKKNKNFKIMNNQLKAKYNELENKHNKFKNKYNESEYIKLQLENDKLKNKNILLESKNNELKSELDVFFERINELQYHMSENSKKRKYESIE